MHGGRLLWQGRCCRGAGSAAWGPGSSDGRWGLQNLLGHVLAKESISLGLEVQIDLLAMAIFVGQAMGQADRRLLGQGAIENTSREVGAQGWRMDLICIIDRDQGSQLSGTTLGHVAKLSQQAPVRPLQCQTLKPCAGSWVVSANRDCIPQIWGWKWIRIKVKNVNQKKNHYIESYSPVLSKFPSQIQT